MHPALAATMSQPDLSVDRARNWLLLMAHSSTCRDHASCPIGRHDCDKLKLLRTHVANCNSSSCPVENCDNARAVLRHYRDCHDRHRCAICHSISFLEDGGNEEGGSHETTWYGESANGVLSPPSKYQPYIIHAAPSPYIPLVISTNHFQRHYSPAGYVAEAAAYPNWFIFPPRSVSHNAENVSSPMQNRQSEPITPPPPPSPPPPKRHLVARRPATAFPEKEQWQASDARDGNRVGHTICAETLVSLRPDAPPLKTNLEGDEEESIEVCTSPFQGELLVRVRAV